ncbi:MAG: hypothetical protein F9K15_24035 [Zoogloea sp.]|nr:MAG: hypothetical protein F9K15_24035 [Zoogloea sp.]
MLVAFSIADQCRARQVDNDRAKISLASLGAGFGALYDAYNNPAFCDARAAVAFLGGTLRLDDISSRYFDKHSREAAERGAAAPELERAIPLLQAGIAAAARIGLDAEIVKLLPQAETLTFDRLKELVCHFSYAKQ